MMNDQYWRVRFLPKNGDAHFMTVGPCAKAEARPIACARWGMPGSWDHPGLAVRPATASQVCEYRDALCRDILSGFYRLLDRWQEFIHDAAKIAFEIELTEEIATAWFLNQGEQDQWWEEKESR